MSDYTLIYISIGSELLPILFTLFLIKDFNLSLKILISLFLFTFFIDLSALSLALMGKHNDFLFVYYDIIRVGLILALYYVKFKELLLKRMVLIMGILALLLFITCKTIPFFQTQMITIQETILGLMVIGITFGYFFEVMKTPAVPKLSAEPFFWFSTAFLLYHSATMFYFIFEGYISLGDFKVYTLLSQINLFANILLNILLAIGVTKYKLASFKDKQTIGQQPY
jgi:hypothetical protein